MSVRPLIFGFFGMLAGIFVILLFFNKCQAPLAASLLAVRAVQESVSEGGAPGVGEKYRFSADMRLRLEQTSASQNHQSQIALAWDGFFDLDLHCTEPGGEEVYYGHRKSRSGAQLDVDMNAGASNSSTPVEHIYFVDGAMLPGEFKVKVVLYSWRGQPPNPVQFRVEIMKNGALESYRGVLRSEQESKTYTFVYP
jgi:hypothetical protein